MELNFRGFKRAAIFQRLSIQKGLRKCTANCGTLNKDDKTITKMSDCPECNPGTCRNCCPTRHGTSWDMPEIQ